MSWNSSFSIGTMDSTSVSVFLYKGEKTIKFPINTPLTSEDIIKKVAQELELRPITLHLFALRYRSEISVWLPPNFKFNQGESYDVEFRLRFKLTSLNNLTRYDDNAFDYTFHQLRYDVLHERIPEFRNEQNKAEVIGLCCTDMIRAIVEGRLSTIQVVNDYRLFIPKSIIKNHIGMFLKKKIQPYISKFLPANGNVENVNVKYIKDQYVSHAEHLAPTYLTEEFTAMAYKVEEYPTTIGVDPFRLENPGICISYVGKQNWEHVCSIEDLCFISMRADGTVEISRKNGIPVCFKFKKLEIAHSFVSLLDGYYRLIEKWTFNLCKEIFCPSLNKLRTLKCHGPIGQKFSYQKLSTHPSTTKNWFILRQSSVHLDEYSIDYLLDNKSFPHTKEIKITTEDYKYFIPQYSKQFDTVAELLAHYIVHPEQDFTIKECLPPSEYDQSPLLLCRSQASCTEKRNPLATDGTLAPQVIAPGSLLFYKGKKYEYEGRLCKSIKAVWNQSKTSRINVVIKILKKENEEKYMKEFLDVANRCVLWQCESLVQLKGVVLGNPKALVLEWMPYGPFDNYLEQNKLHVQAPELIEAMSYISKALWFLEDHGIVHGNIRCRNVLVYEHSDNGLIVKLADPSITECSPEEIHWIPPELFEIPTLSKSFVTADVWATGTTFWEVFSYGAKPPTESSISSYKSKYLNGWRLPRPDKCPLEIHRLISECWSHSPDTRKRPQALVRDIHQILYQLIGSKRVHAYSTVSPASSETGTSHQPELDVTDNFNWTSFGSDRENNLGGSSDGTLSTFIRDVSANSDRSRCTQSTWLFQEVDSCSCYDLGSQHDSPSPDLISGFSEFYNNGSIGTVYSTHSAMGIYEFRNNQVTLHRVIGQGFYGRVYLGEIVHSDGSREAVAVKKMKEKKEYLLENEMEFIREFEMLQKLCHPNIVEVKGVVHEPDLLLIMEYLNMGSLLDYFQTSYGRKPNRRQLMKFTQDVAEGMEYLSDNNIVHRDLAARNLLVASEDTIKISDFGLARCTDNDNCYTVRTRRHFPIKWYPPESIEFLKFSEKSDVWSYGVTVYEIFSYGTDPTLPDLLKNQEQDPEAAPVVQEEILNLLKQGVRLPCPDTCPQSVYTHLMLPCWELDPRKRPTFKTIRGEIMKIEHNLF